MKRILLIVGAVLVVFLLFFFFVLPPLFDRFVNRVVENPNFEPSEQAERLHESAFIADLHSDALLWRRNLLRRHSRGHVDVPRLLAGNVAVQFFTIVSKVPFGLNIERNEDSTDMITLLAIAQRWPLRTWSSLLQRTLYQSEKLHRFAAASDGRLHLIESVGDLEDYLQDRAQDANVTAGVLGIEGAHALEGTVANFDRIFEAGFRMIGLTHFFDNAFGGSAHGVDKGGITDQGRELVARMQARGVLVDLAHASPKLIEDVLAMTTRPVVVSHTGVRGTCDNVRNLTDEHVIGIAETGGVIGVGFWDTAVCGTDAAAIVRTMRYVADLVGVDHVALGSDFDGTVTTPFDAAGLIRLTQGLLEAGFSETEIRQIMGGNVLRVMRQCFPVGRATTQKMPRLPRAQTKLE